MTTHELLVLARDAKRSVAALGAEKKRGVLYDIASSVLRCENEILYAKRLNCRDRPQR